MEKEEENVKNLEAYPPVKNFVIAEVFGLLPLCVVPPRSLFQYSHHHPKGEKSFFFFLNFSSSPLQIILCAICDLFAIAFNC